MHGPERDRDLDERLRAALEPSAQVVRRVIAGALHPSEGREGGEALEGGRVAARRLWPRFAAAGSLAAVVTVMLLVLAPRLRPPPPCLLVNRGAVFVVRDASGAATILGADSTPAVEELLGSPAASSLAGRTGSLLFITHGERPGEKR